MNEIPQTLAEESEGGLPSHALFVDLVRRHNLAANDLTEKQLAEAIRQALPDFRRHVHATSQAVIYLPGSDAERWKSLYHDLLWSVESKYEGESRHDTALRYIRERETHSSAPASDSSTNADVEATRGPKKDHE